MDLYDLYSYGSGYGSGYSSYSSPSYYSTASSGGSSWPTVAIVLAIIGGLVLYFTFLAKRNEGKFNGFLGWTYEFLTFKKMSIEHILKIVYLVLAIYITLMSFSVISYNFLMFLGILILGNLLLRVFFEFSLVLLIICRNTTEINNKMNKNN